MQCKPYLKATAAIFRLVAYIMLLALPGGIFYRRNSRTAHQFYYCMCSHQMFRTLYSITFALLIVTVNTLYVIHTRDYAYASLTLAISTPLLLDRLSHPVLRTLRHSTEMLYCVMLVLLISLFSHRLLSFGISLYFLQVAAIYYPSRRAMDRVQTYDGLRYYRNHPEMLTDIYFE